MHENSCGAHLWASEGFQYLGGVLYAEALVLQGEEHDLPLGVQRRLHAVPFEDHHHLVLLDDLASFRPELGRCHRDVDLHLVGGDGHECLPAAEAGGGEPQRIPPSASAAFILKEGRSESLGTMTSARASTSASPHPISLESLASNSPMLLGASSLPRATSLA